VDKGAVDKGADAKGAVDKRGWDRSGSRVPTFITFADIFKKRTLASDVMESRYS